jgi:hypothetical protein
MFLKVERYTLKSLKTMLQYRGVYTGNNCVRVVDSLFNLLGRENALEWDPADFQSMDFDPRSKAYKR